MTERIARTLLAADRLVSVPIQLLNAALGRLNTGVRRLNDRKAA